MNFLHGPFGLEDGTKYQSDGKYNIKNYEAVKIKCDKLGVYYGLDRSPL